MNTEVQTSDGTDLTEVSSVINRMSTDELIQELIAVCTTDAKTREHILKTYGFTLAEKAKQKPPPPPPLKTSSPRISSPTVEGNLVVALRSTQNEHPNALDLNNLRTIFTTGNAPKSVACNFANITFGPWIVMTYKPSRFRRADPPNFFKPGNESENTLEEQLLPSPPPLPLNLVSPSMVSQSMRKTVPFIDMGAVKEEEQNEEEDIFDDKQKRRRKSAKFIALLSPRRSSIARDTPLVSPRLESPTTVAPSPGDLAGSNKVVSMVQDQKKIAETTQIVCHAIRPQELERVKQIDETTKIVCDIETRDPDRSLAAYSPSFEFDGGLEKEKCNRTRKNESPYPNIRNGLFCIRVTSWLTFDHIGPVEPLFVRMAIYDKQSKCKVTQDVSFHANNDQICNMMGSYKMQERLMSTRKQWEKYDNIPTFVFNMLGIPPHENLFLLIWVERILQAAPDQAFKAYKEGNRVDRQRTSAKMHCQYLDHVRSKFLYAAVPLFDEHGNCSPQVTVNHLYSCESLGLDFNQAVFNIYDKKQHEEDGVQCHMSLQVFDPVLSSNETRIKELLPPAKDTNQHLVDRILKNLPVAQGLTVPYHQYQHKPLLDYHNTLYLYPETIDCTRLKTKTILVKVSVRREDKVHSPPIEMIEDPEVLSSLLPHTLLSVTWHATSPRFLDEVAISLPTSTDRAELCRYHVLFEFFNIRTTSKAIKSVNDIGEANATPIGYTVLSLFDNQGTLVADGQHILPVQNYELEDGYVKTSNNETKINFSLSVKQKSILHMQDPNATLFLRTCDEILRLLSINNGSLARGVVKSLNDRREQLSCLRHSSVSALPQTPLFLHMLICIMGEAEPHREQHDEVRDLCSDVWSAFLFLLRSVVSLTGDAARVGILSVYVHHLFSNPINVRVPFHKAFLAQWNQFLRRVQFDNDVKNYDPNAISWNRNSDGLRLDLSGVRGDSPPTTPIKVPKSPANLLRQQDLEGSPIKRSTSDLVAISPNSPSSPSAARRGGSLNVRTADEYRLTAVDSLRFSWLCYTMLIKSVSLYTSVEHNHEFDKDTILDQDFNVTLSNFINNVTPVLVDCYERRFSHNYLLSEGAAANRELALFLRDIIPFAGSKIVFELVHLYFRNLKEDQFSQISLRLEFLEIFAEYEDFFTLITDDHESVTTMLKDMVATVRAALSSTGAGDNILRKTAIQFLKNHLTRFDFDARFVRDVDSRKTMAKAYFGFVTCILSDLDKIVEVVSQSGTDLNDLLACFYFIIHNCDKEHITQHFAEQSQDTIYKLCNLLTISFISVRNQQHRNVRMLLLRDALSLLDLALLQSWLPTHAEPYLAKAQAIYDEYEKTGIEPNIITESQTTSSSATVIDSTDSESTRNSDVDYGSSVEASSYEGYGVLDDASQPLPTRHPVVSIHHENDDERKHFYKLFGKASYIILNVILASPVTDTHTLQTLFADFALPFVTKYKALYLMSEILYEDDYQNSTSDDAVINDYSEVASPWRSLLGGVLLHVKLPSLLQTLPIIHDTLDQLLQVYPLIAREKEEEREKESVRVDYNPKYLPTNKVISAATLDKLVSRLFKENPGYPHAPFEQCFFLTYRSFADADTVLDTIKRQLSRREHDEERLIRISNAIGYWVNGFYSTFTSKFLASVIRFVNQMLALSSPPEAIQQLQRNLSKNLILCLRVNRKQHNERPPRIIVPVRFKPAMLSGNVRTRFDLLEWDEIELARQMTIIDASMFHAMHYTELFEKGPNLDRLTDRFNDTSSWVIHKIVQEPDRNTRVKIYSKMVDIAYELLNLKNFHGSFAIISGLNSSPIFTLKQDLALIPKRTEERLKELGLLFRIPYSQLRKLVNETNPPCVLFVGLPLSDLIHLSENPNERKGMINFNKRLQSVGVIETFQAKQKREYNLEIVPFLMRYLSSISDELQYSQDSLYEIAQQLEKTGE